ncbi:MAG: hypothetical protein ACI9EW_000956 [Cellvibrionaceae bacterium]|jgi:hypothetical protein
MLSPLVFAHVFIGSVQSQKVSVQIFLPVVMKPEFQDPVPLPKIYHNTELDSFETAKRTLENEGMFLAHNKIGFHVGSGGYLDGIGDYFRQLDAAGVPIFIKGVDGGGVIYEVQELAKVSGVPHVMVFRRTGGLFELPNYDNDPIREAKIHYDRLVAAWPQELDPSMVWMETVNEPDKNRSEWLAQYSLATAKLAVADGRRYAAFSWSSGEPEPYHWEGTAMLEFLAYAAEHKDLVAVALHEYSYTRESISQGYPWLVGRFQLLFEKVDQHGINRPTILITEWGWEYQKIPSVEAAIEDIQWAGRLYAAYPDVLGAAIWYLGGGYGGITYATHHLIEPLGNYSTSTYFGVIPGVGRIDPSVFYDQGNATHRKVGQASDFAVSNPSIEAIVAEAKKLRLLMALPAP